MRPSAVQGCVGSDPAEAGRVLAGWRQVELLEAADGLRSPDRSAWLHWARAESPDLEPWPECPPNAWAVYVSDTNRVRFFRTRSFVRTGDRVFDIGLGRGYQAGVLLRDAGLAAYTGIDLEPRKVAATRGMLAAQRMTGRDVTVEQGDLYDLTAERLGRSAPDLVLCCEVLEHVPDPERAVAVLAAALPADAELLFSVPLHGRLERVWGHVTVFDAARVRAMTAAAGLFVHHVETVADTWALLLTSRRAERSERAAVAASLHPELRQQTGPPHDFVPVDPTQATPTASRGASVDLARTRHGCTCTVRASPWGSLPWRRAGYGGLSLPVPALSGVRLELGLADREAARTLTVRVHDGARRTAEWRAPVTRLAGATGGRATVVLRPGRSSELRARAPEDAVTGPIDADRLEVGISVPPGRVGRFRLLRAAYLT